MLTKITLADIKLQAKIYKKENPTSTHSESLKIISQKYGFEKYEILKSKADDSDGMIQVNIDTKKIFDSIRSLSLPMIFTNLTFEELEKLSDEDKQKFIKTSSVKGCENIISEHINKILDNTVEQRWILQTNDSLEDFIRGKKIAIIGKMGAGKSTVIRSLHKMLDKKSTLFINWKDNNHNNNPRLPDFINATFNTNETNLAPYETVVIEEPYLLKKNAALRASLNESLSDDSKTIIITSQQVEDIEALGVNLFYISSLRGSKENSSALIMYEILKK